MKNKNSKELRHMKYIRQFMIILTISFIGEVLKYFIPLPIPASIYGLVILFIALETGILRLSSVRDTAKFLIEIMPLMFIPAGVGLLDSWGVLRPVLIPVFIITVVSTILVMAAAGRVTQYVIRAEKEGETCCE
jgi:holin-like protein